MARTKMTARKFIGSPGKAKKAGKAEKTGTMVPGPASAEGCLSDQPLMMRPEVIASLVERLVNGETPPAIMIAALSTLSRIAINGQALFGLLADIATSAEIPSMQMLAVRAIGNMTNPPAEAARVCAYVLEESTSYSVKHEAAIAVARLLVVAPRLIVSNSDTVARLVKATGLKYRTTHGWMVHRRSEHRKQQLAEAARAASTFSVGALLLLSPGPASKALASDLQRLVTSDGLALDGACTIDQWTGGSALLRLWSSTLLNTDDAAATSSARTMVHAALASWEDAKGSFEEEPSYARRPPPLVVRLATFSGYWRSALAAVAIFAGVGDAIVTGAIDKTGEGWVFPAAWMSHSPSEIKDLQVQGSGDETMSWSSVVATRFGLSFAGISGLLLTIGCAEEDSGHVAGWWKQIAAGNAPEALLDTLALTILRQGGPAAGGRSHWVQSAAIALVELLNRFTSVHISTTLGASSSSAAAAAVVTTTEPDAASAAAASSSDSVVTKRTPEVIAVSCLTPLRAAALAVFLVTPHSPAADRKLRAWQHEAFGAWDAIAAGAARLLGGVVGAESSLAGPYEEALSAISSSRVTAGASMPITPDMPDEEVVAASAAIGSRNSLASAITEALQSAEGNDTVQAALLDVLATADPSLLTTEQAYDTALVVATGAVSGVRLQQCFALLSRMGDSLPADITSFVRWLAAGVPVSDMSSLPSWMIAEDTGVITRLGRALLVGATKRSTSREAVAEATKAIAIVDGTSTGGGAPAASGAGADDTTAIEAVASAETSTVTVLVSGSDDSIHSSNITRALGHRAASARSLAAALGDTIESATSALQLKKSLAAVGGSGSMYTVRDGSGSGVYHLRVGPLAWTSATSGDGSGSVQGWMSSLMRLGESASSAAAIVPPPMPNPGSHAIRIWRHRSRWWGAARDVHSPEEQAAKAWGTFIETRSATIGGIQSSLALSNRSLKDKAAAGAAVTASNARALETVAVETLRDGTTKSDGIIIRALGRVVEVADAQVSERRSMFVRWALAKRG